MTKGSGTRSGLLWEVERLLNEVENLPQVLLMENVPQVHSKANMSDFQKWIDFLSSKGYSNYWKDLNAKNYGVAQNRNRCFMVSILGDYQYEFPKRISLIKMLKDYLEENVEKRYYLSESRVRSLFEHKRRNTEKGNGFGARIVSYNDISSSLTTSPHKSAGQYFMGEDGRIRTLTPKESYRLMDFTDQDFHKAESVNSNTQLYKQAGNSIVRNVLVAIIGQMLQGNEEIYKGVIHQ